MDWEGRAEKRKRLELKLKTNLNIIICRRIDFDLFSWLVFWVGINKWREVCVIFFGFYFCLVFDGWIEIGGMVSRRR